MKISIIPIDSMVILDGVPVTFDFGPLIDPGIHAIQWDGTSGEIEYKDPKKVNEKISDINSFQEIVDLYGTTLEQREAERLSKEQEAEANKTYLDRRRPDYPPVEDQLGLIWEVIRPSSGSDAEAMKNAIISIHNKYPKP
jgi:hypothetical protein